MAPNSVKQVPDSVKQVSNSVKQCQILINPVKRPCKPVITVIRVPDCSQDPYYRCVLLPLGSPTPTLKRVSPLYVYGRLVLRGRCTGGVWVRGGYNGWV